MGLRGGALAWPVCARPWVQHFKKKICFSFEPKVHFYSGCKRNLNTLQVPRIPTGWRFAGASLAGLGRLWVPCLMRVCATLARTVCVSACPSLPHRSLCPSLPPWPARSSLWPCSSTDSLKTHVWPWCLWGLRHPSRASRLPGLWVPRVLPTPPAVWSPCGACLPFPPWRPLPAAWPCVCASGPRGCLPPTTCSPVPRELPGSVCSLYHACACVCSGPPLHVWPGALPTRACRPTSPSPPTRGPLLAPWSPLAFPLQNNPAAPLASSC